MLVVKRLGLQKLEDEKKPSTELGKEAVLAAAILLRGKLEAKPTPKVTLTISARNRKIFFFFLYSNLLCKSNW